jgi:SAM-dependent methyltransferase
MLDLNTELNPRLLDTLRCPVCGAPMGVDGNGRSLACRGLTSDRNPKGKKHLFDDGAGGYVNLAPNHSGGGDSKEAVRARSSFLRSGYYTPAAEAIAALARELTPEDGLVLDAGCGEGYYSNCVAQEGYPVLGVDLSKFAADTACLNAEEKIFYRISQQFIQPVLQSFVRIFERKIERCTLARRQANGFFSFGNADTKVKCQLAFAYLGNACHDVAACSDKRIHTEL